MQSPPPCKDLQALEFENYTHCLGGQIRPHHCSEIGSVGPSQLIFLLATITVFMILNYSRGLDLFFMLETDLGLRISTVR